MLMEHPIVQKIMKEGINSVNLSMLDDSSRKNILEDVGEKLYRESRYKEAIEIFTKANQTDKLVKYGDLFMNEGKTELATLFYLPTKDKQRLNNAAVMCIQSKNYDLAASAYRAADNHQMASFIEKNFTG